MSSDKIYSEFIKDIPGPEAEAERQRLEAKSKAKAKVETAKEEGKTSIKLITDKVYRGQVTVWFENVEPLIYWPERMAIPNNLD